MQRIFKYIDVQNIGLILQIRMKNLMHGASFYSYMYVIIQRVTNFSKRTLHYAADDDDEWRTPDVIMTSLSL